MVGGEQSPTSPDQETLQASQTPARVLAEEDLVAGGGEEDILHHQDHNDLNDYDLTKSRVVHDPWRNRQTDRRV